MWFFITQNRVFFYFEKSEDWKMKNWKVENVGTLKNWKLWKNKTWKIQKKEQWKTIWYHMVPYGTSAGVGRDAVGTPQVVWIFDL